MNPDELVAAIVAAPEAEEAWVFYADWLLDRGHPRGEMIYLQAAADAGELEAFHRLRRLEDDEAPLLSPRLAATSRHWRFDWKRGFIHGAVLRCEEGEPDVEMVAALCTDPHAALLAGLTLDYYQPGPGPRSVDRSRNVSLANLDDELARFGRLTALRLGGVELPSLRHAALRVLHLEHSPVLGGNLELPALERLIWDLRDPALLVAPASIAQAPPPSLVRFEHPLASDALIASLAASSLARQLEELVIGTHGYSAILALRNHAAAFPRIRRIRLTPPRRHLQIAADSPDLTALRNEPRPDEETAAALRADLQRSLSGVEIDFAMMLPLLPGPPRAPSPRVQFDSQSRGPDGRIDALGKWISESQRR